MALLALLLGAWVAVVAFVGPSFGYPATATASWQWTTRNWLLHLIPGAVTVVAALMIMMVAGAHAPGARTVIRLCALAMIVAGAWLVIGPALWPVFESGRPYAGSADATTAFTKEIGANLGPGLLIVALGAMIMESVEGIRGRSAAVPVEEAPLVTPAAAATSAAAPLAERESVRRTDTAPPVAGETSRPAEVAGGTSRPGEVAGGTSRPAEVVQREPGVSEV
jgi:hypothetical protein